MNSIFVFLTFFLESAKEIFQIDFIREIQVMKKIGYHENIVSMLGCCTSKRPICLIVEHIPLGDLLSYLRNQRHNIKNVSSSRCILCLE